MVHPELTLEIFAKAAPPAITPISTGNDQLLLALSSTIKTGQASFSDNLSQVFEFPLSVANLSSQDCVILEFTWDVAFVSQNQTFSLDNLPEFSPLQSVKRLPLTFSNKQRNDIPDQKTNVCPFSLKANDVHEMVLKGVVEREGSSLSTGDLRARLHPSLVKGVDVIPKAVFRVQLKDNCSRDLTFYCEYVDPPLKLENEDYFRNSRKEEVLFYVFSDDLAALTREHVRVSKDPTGGVKATSSLGRYLRIRNQADLKRYVDKAILAEEDEQVVSNLTVKDKLETLVQVNREQKKATGLRFKFGGVDEVYTIDPDLLS